MYAYRSAPATSHEVVLLLCVHCGVSNAAPRTSETFRCAACTKSQRTIRDEATLEATSVVLKTKAANDGYKQLAALATSFGEAGGVVLLGFECDGVVCEVSLSLNSGKVDGVFVTAASNGLPGIAFKQETPRHVAAKSGGVTREVQTGDPEFDRRVFIESAAPDADVALVVESPTVRLAIMHLLESSAQVTLSAEGVESRTPDDFLTVFDPARLRQSIVAARVIAGAPRPTSVRIVARPAVAFVLLIGGLLVPLGPTAFAVGLGMYCPARATLPLIVLGVSAVLALALQPILKHVLRGRSNSHVDLLLARVASFTFLPTFCLGVAVFANGFFDGSAQTEHSLAVAAVEYDATDDHETSVTTSHDASGFGGGEYDFDDQLHAIKLGDRITVSTKPGAFGFVWELGTVRCFTSGGEIDE